MSARIFYAIGFIAMVGIIITASCQQKADVPVIPDNYRSWNKTIDRVFDYPIPGHENNCRIIYINSVGEQVRPTVQNTRTFYDYPEGTMIVKEIYNGLEPPKPGETPQMLTVMVKNRQHPLSRGGWVWVVKEVQTGKETIIDYEFCVDCHANANEAHPYGDKNPEAEFRDYVFFPPATKK